MLIKIFNDFTFYFVFMARGKELSVGEKGLVVKLHNYFKQERKIFWKKTRSGKIKLSLYFHCCIFYF